jgi:cell division protein FtsB
MPGRQTPSGRPSGFSARPTTGLRAGDAGRSGSRPASARRPATTGAARRTAPPEPRRRSGRATALGLVLLALMLAYAYPVRLYLAQQAQIQQIQTSQDAQRAEIRDLKNLSNQWNDPAFIAAQARARFLMVAPGSKTYIVQAAPVPPPTPKSTAKNQPWYGQLWSSVRSADDPGRS